MITIKIKYNVSDTIDSDLIYTYIRQYNSAYNVGYNMFNQVKDMSITSIKKKDSPIQERFNTLNNIDLLDTWFRISIIDDINASYIEDKKVIFGTKKLFERRRKGLISKEDYAKQKLRPLYSIGEADKHGNRKFRLTEDGNLIFQPERNVKIKLNLIPNKRKSVLDKIYILQCDCSTPITYKLDFNYVYISIDETKLEYHKVETIKNRVMAIDMNPNYIGWSIVDWNSSSSYDVIKSGVISIKGLNDKQNRSKEGSTGQSKYSNKRQTNIDLISKNLINTAIYYKCSIFSIEELKFDNKNKDKDKNKDKERGKKYNRLVNNLWCRNRLVNNLSKRCNINGIRLQSVKAEYSSFIGNILYRELNLPDMVLSSIEIGRRAYEFVSQYINKTNIQRKNIVFPDVNDFYGAWTKSLEEFNLSDKIKTWKQFYSEIKKSKQMYRLSLDNFDLKFSIFLTPNLYCNRYIFG